MQGRWREAYVKWRGVIAEQSGSGQSAAVFCRDRGLTTGQFFAWKQRLRRLPRNSSSRFRLRGRSGAEETLGSAIEVHLAEGRRGTRAVFE